jgi:uncharacterized protein (TIGR02118 family)
MIRVTALYRNLEGSRFDFDYYVTTHFQLVRERLADFGMGRIEVEKGIEAMDGQRAAFVCVAHVDFSDMADLKRGLEEHGEELLADVPNYTDIEPEVQISEVVEAK